MEFLHRLGCTNYENGIPLRLHVKHAVLIDWLACNMHFRDAKITLLIVGCRITPRVERLNEFAVVRSVAVSDDYEVMRILVILSKSGVISRIIF